MQLEHLVVNNVKAAVVVVVAVAVVVVAANLEVKVERIAKY